MNTAKLRSKRILFPTIAAVAALGIGGVIWATTANADDLNRGERDRVGTAAIEAVGGGKVVEAESSDDVGEAYEVEVRLPDGTEVDVSLDEKLDVVSKDYDDDRRDDNDNDANDTPDADDRALSASERTSAEKAALKSVGSGTIVDVDASDDRGVAYEVEVCKTDGTEWNVDLDADFKVLQKSIDR